MSHRHLTFKNRAQIEVGLKQNMSNVAIAGLIGCHESTISRERSRNSTNDIYDAELAHQHASEVRSNGMKQNSKTTQQMKDFIAEKMIEKEWSPDQICKRCQEANIPMIGRSRIYELIHQDRAAGGIVYQSLRHGGKKQKPRGKGHTAGRGLIPGRVDILERPAIVDEKIRVGDLEIDTIIGAGKQSALLTIVDRVTYLTKIVLLKNLEATTVSNALNDCLRAFSPHLHTITSDNGKEFAYHQQVSDELEIDYYFCQPYHSWERGVNEHTNKLIRQYYPKGFDFWCTTATEVQIVENKLNNRPRNKLKYRTPNEVFDEFLRRTEEDELAQETIIIDDQLLNQVEICEWNV